MADTAAAKAVVQRIVDDVWNRGDLAAVDELIAEDMVEHGALGEGGGGGRDGARKTVGGFRAGFPDLSLEAAHLIAEGEYVALRWVAGGTHEGEFMGVPPTGRTVSVDGFDLYRVVDGLVVEHWGYPDVLGLMKQLRG